jgi:hypothetical protein
VPELSPRHDPKLFYFASTPTIDIEPLIIGKYEPLMAAFYAAFIVTFPCDSFIEFPSARFLFRIYAVVVNEITSIFAAFPAHEPGKRP